MPVIIETTFKREVPKASCLLSRGRFSTACCSARIYSQGCRCRRRLARVAAEVGNP